MKCLSCGTVYDESIHGECPICGLEEVSIPTDVESEFKKELEKEIKFAEVYRESILGNIHIRIPVYSSLDDKENLNYIEYEAVKLQLDKENWTREAFLDPGREITIELEIANGDTIDKKTVAISSPRWEYNFCKLGVAMREGFQIQILYGMEKKFNSSDMIPIVG